MSPNPPYDTVYTILSTARTRLNDELVTLYPVSGKLLENNTVFTQQTVNTAWRKLQEYLANLGYVRLVDEAQILNLPPVTSSDPASQVSLNWFGYFDGTSQQPAPVLPPLLTYPLKVWERQSGTGAAYLILENIFDGLPTWAKSPRNRFWEWRSEAIHMPGATYQMDLRIRYVQYLPDFIDITASPGPQQVIGPWYQQPAPMMRCLDAFSFYICAEMAESRGLEPEPWQAKAEAAAKLIMNRDQKAKQRGNIRRLSRSGRLEGQEWGYYGGYY